MSNQAILRLHVSTINGHLQANKEHFKVQQSSTLKMFFVGLNIFKVLFCFALKMFFVGPNIFKVLLCFTLKCSLLA